MQHYSLKNTPASSSSSLSSLKRGDSSPESAEPTDPVGDCLPDDVERSLVSGERSRVRSVAPEF